MHAVQLPKGGDGTDSFARIWPRGGLSSFETELKTLAPKRYSSSRSRPALVPTYPKPPRHLQGTVYLSAAMVRSNFPAIVSLFAGHLCRSES
jgi:hypothetical protein